VHSVSLAALVNISITICGGLLGNLIAILLTLLGSVCLNLIVVLNLTALIAIGL
jgi:hypothetical protein